MTHRRSKKRHVLKLPFCTYVKMFLNTYSFFVGKYFFDQMKNSCCPLRSCRQSDCELYIFLPYCQSRKQASALILEKLQTKHFIPFVSMHCKYFLTLFNPDNFLFQLKAASPFLAAYWIIQLGPGAVKADDVIGFNLEKAKQNCFNPKLGS